jgi:hypothetical protein
MRDREVWKGADLREVLQMAPQSTRDEWETQLRGGGTGEQLIRLINLDAACERISVALVAAAHLQDNASVYLPYRYDVELLLACQPELLRDQPLSFPDADNWLLTRVIELEVPGIASLDPEQLIELRSSSGEFDAFRKELSNAIRTADSLPKNTFDRAKEVKRLTSEGLASARDKLEEALRKSRTLAALKKGSVAMTGGALSAAVVSTLDPTKVISLPLVVALLAGAGVSGLVAAVAAAREVPGKSRAKRAASAHYVAML